MFNSTIFDVVFGLVSVFLAMSLFTSALTEAVSTIVGLRARTLLTGIKQLVNDPNLSGLALNLYNHALFNPLSNGTTKAGTTPAVKPSYIDPRQFALALTDAIHQTADQAATLDQAITKIADPQIKATLQVMFQRANGEADAFRDELAKWFDSAMNRLSGTYKRWTKLMSFVLALLVAGLFNADPIHLADTLWQRAAVAALLAKLNPPATAGQDQALALLQQIEAVGPLLGWGGFTHDRRN